MKRFIKRILQRFGFDIIRYATPDASRSLRTKSLNYFKTATGNYYLPRDAHGDIIANAIKANRIFEEEIVNAAKKYIKPDMAVLDVGANFGQMSILFSRLTGTDGKVYAFEADDFIFDILTRNIEANELGGRIIPVFGAIHSITGQTLYFPEQDFVRFQTYGSYGIDYGGRSGRPVPTITIDSLGIEEPISFMKVDIQGGDLHAMKGAVRTIARNKMPILFEYEFEFEAELKLSFQAYVDFVNQIGYRFESVISGKNYLIVPK